MRATLTTLGELAGLAIVVYGVCMIYPPVGVIVLGIGVFCVSLMSSYPPVSGTGSRTPDQERSDRMEAGKPPQLAAVTDLGLLGGDQ